MSQIIIAPNIDKPLFTSVFLAGGITNCKDWQADVIKELEFEDVTIFNPRQKKFDVTDKIASYKQIAWEFERLERMDIFSMYFCEGDSDQPICMYELGRNIIRMQNRFPADWENRIIISVENRYKRKTDVLVQTELCAPKIFVNTDSTPECHADYIKRAIRRIIVSSLKITFKSVKHREPGGRMWIRLSGFMGGDTAVGVYGWLVGGLAVMFVLMMLYAMLCAGPGISPDEEARILAEERRRRELEKEVREREKRGRGTGAG